MSCAKVECFERDRFQCKDGKPVLANDLANLFGDAVLRFGQRWH